MKKLYIKKLTGRILALSLLLGSVDAYGVTPYTWDGLVSKDMTLNTNWSTNVLPSSGNHAYIPANSGNFSPNILTRTAVAHTLSVDSINFTGNEEVTVGTTPYNALISGGPTQLQIGSGGVIAPSGVTGNFQIQCGVKYNTSLPYNGYASITNLGPACTGGGVVNYFVGNAPANEQGVTVLTLTQGQTSGSLANIDINSTYAVYGHKRIPYTTILNLTTDMTLNKLEAPQIGFPLAKNSSINLGGVLTTGAIDGSNAAIYLPIRNYSHPYYGYDHAGNTVSVGGLIKVNSGGLILETSRSNPQLNTYGSATVGTIIKDGFIYIGTDKITLGMPIAPLTFDGGALVYHGLSGFIYTLPNPIVVTPNNGVLNTNGCPVTQTCTTDAPLTGTGNLDIQSIAAGFPPYPPFDTPKCCGTFILTNNNSGYGGTLGVGVDTTLQGTIDFRSIPSVDILNDGTVQFSQGVSNVVYGGAMTGAGIVLIDNGTTVEYNNTRNSYSGGTTVSGGSTLTGNGNCFPQGIADVIMLSNVGANTLNFRQTSDNSYAGQVAGSGVITTVGSGTNKLILIGDSSGFSGTTYIPEGNVNLIDSTSALGGTMVVNGGILSGIGRAGTANLLTSVTSGGVKPGNSPGTLTLAGDYSQIGGFLYIDLNSAGNVPGINNGQLVVLGSTTLSKTSQVVVNSLDGSFYLGGKYTIVTSTEPVNGQYNSIVATNTTIVPEITYDNNHVYLDFSSPFVTCANNENGKNVALQLVTIVSPTPSEQLLLRNFSLLSCPEIGIALNQMSGSQYPGLLLSTELATHQFVRRLYDPVRTFLANNLCCCERDNCCCRDGLEAWAEGGATSSRFKSTKGARGFKNKGYQISAGIQMSPNNTWVVGAAIEYEHTNSNFNIGGTANTKTVLGGLYGSYRMSDFYFMGDLVLGGSQSTLKRHFYVGAEEYFERGKPETLQGILYTELGCNIRFCSFLIQPFVGLEGGYYRHKHFKEYGDQPVALSFGKKLYKTFDTRLGVHLVLDNLFSGFYGGIDLALQNSGKRVNNSLTAKFVDFGDSFQVHGSHLNRNSFEAGVNIEQEIGDHWSIYASGYWQQWSNAHAYDVLGGVSFNW